MGYIQRLLQVVDGAFILPPGTVAVPQPGKRRAFAGAIADLASDIQRLLVVTNSVVYLSKRLIAVTYADQYRTFAGAIADLTIDIQRLLVASFRLSKPPHTIVRCTQGVQAFFLEIWITELTLQTLM